MQKSHYMQSKLLLAEIIIAKSRDCLLHKNDIPLQKKLKTNIQFYENI